MPSQSLFRPRSLVKAWPDPPRDALSEVVLRQPGVVNDGSVDGISPSTSSAVKRRGSIKPLDFWSSAVRI